MCVCSVCGASKWTNGIRSTWITSKHSKTLIFYVISEQCELTMCCCRCHSCGAHSISFHSSSSSVDIIIRQTTECVPPIAAVSLLKDERLSWAMSHGDRNTECVSKWVRQREIQRNRDKLNSSVSYRRYHCSLLTSNAKLKSVCIVLFCRIYFWIRFALAISEICVSTSTSPLPLPAARRRINGVCLDFSTL